MTKLPGGWLVIGAGSLVGSRFVGLLEDTNILRAGGDNDGDIKLDVTDSEQVKSVINSFQGKYIINFAGATVVDEIEKERPQNLDNEDELNQNLAYKINVLGTRNILKAAKETNKFPIFISTGFVFDGKNGPYSEEDPIAQNPEDVSWYAWTKILAEKEVERSGVKSLTIRISYPYRSEYEGKMDFGRTFLKLYDDFKNGTRDSIYPIFADQTLTPTFIDDLPKAIAILIEKEATGIYHVTSPEITTPYDFCIELLKVARGLENPEEIIKKGSIEEFQSVHSELAKRPIYGGEKSDKISKLGFIPTSCKEGIKLAYG